MYQYRYDDKGLPVLCEACGCWAPVDVFPHFRLGLVPAEGTAPFEAWLCQICGDTLLGTLIVGEGPQAQLALGIAQLTNQVLDQVTERTQDRKK